MLIIDGNPWIAFAPLRVMCRPSNVTQFICFELSICGNISHKKKVTKSIINVYYGLKLGLFV